MKQGGECLPERGQPSMFLPRGLLPPLLQHRRLNILQVSFQDVLLGGSGRLLIQTNHSWTAYQWRSSPPYFKIAYGMALSSFWHEEGIHWHTPAAILAVAAVRWGNSKWSACHNEGRLWISYHQQERLFL